MRKPTIYEAMAAKLGRVPTNAELNAECRRIIREGYLESRGFIADRRDDITKPDTTYSFPRPTLVW